jgi:acyl-CoA synthetase (AMP-forming)/AMP-acid ligase II
LSQGIKPGDWVAVYLQNCPEFMFIWLGLWAIGCAPALINYSLTGETLKETIRNCGSSLIVVDEEISERVLVMREMLELDLKVKIRILDQNFKDQIAYMAATRPDDSCRVNVTGEDNQALIYTRYLAPSLGQGVLTDAYPVAHLANPKACLISCTTAIFMVLVV